MKHTVIGDRYVEAHGGLARWHRHSAALALTADVSLGEPLTLAMRHGRDLPMAVPVIGDHGRLTIGRTASGHADWVELTRTPLAEGVELLGVRRLDLEHRPAVEAVVVHDPRASSRLRHPGVAALHDWLVPAADRVEAHQVEALGSTDDDQELAPALERRGHSGLREPHPHDYLGLPPGGVAAALHEPHTLLRWLECGAEDPRHDLLPPTFATAATSAERLLEHAARVREPDALGGRLRAFAEHHLGPLRRELAAVRPSHRDAAYVAAAAWLSVALVRSGPGPILQPGWWWAQSALIALGLCPGGQRPPA